MNPGLLSVILIVVIFLVAYIGLRAWAVEFVPQQTRGIVFVFSPITKSLEAVYYPRATRLRRLYFDREWDPTIEITLDKQCTAAETAKVVERIAFKRGLNIKPAALERGLHPDIRRSLENILNRIRKGNNSSEVFFRLFRDSEVRCHELSELDMWAMETFTLLWLISKGVKGSKDLSFGKTYVPETIRFHFESKRAVGQ